MSQKTNLTTQPVDQDILSKRMLLGAGIALALILIFLIPVRDPNPDWGAYWMLKPLIVVPIAGAMGSTVFYFFIDYLRYKSIWKKVLAYTVSLIGYIIAIWFGIVLGLDGTMWN